MEQHGTSSRLPRVVALIGAVGSLLTGVGALAAPRAFFDAVATFEPYNQHFIQDIGAFNLGLAAVLFLAARPRADALFVALAGATVGGLAHLASHLIGLDLGGQPAADIPLFSIVAGLSAVGAVARYRELDR